MCNKLHRFSGNIFSCDLLRKLLNTNTKSKLFKYLLLSHLRPLKGWAKEKAPSTRPDAFSKVLDPLQQELAIELEADTY